MSVYPPQHQPMPSGSTGTCPCGNYAGFAIFNNGGACFVPDSGTTMGLVAASADGVSVPGSDYEVMWRFSATQRGCAQPVAGSDTQKSFNVSPGKSYVFTVYFKPGKCPAQGANVSLDVSFQ